jgi:UDP-hydrolysing UDP-N-acetyl-D-glucosamine 2-epimerase
MPRKHERRRVCFVTGTRAECGLMRSSLCALRDHPAIELQIIATGSHTQRGRGDTLKEMRRDGWTIDATVPWKDDTSPVGIARAMGAATVKLAEQFAKLKSDIVLVVGDRVEAFAAASAAAVSDRVLAHVHGGDRALGQVDDSLRHAISKLAHVHFAATRESGERLFRLGEDRERIHVVGAPGIDGIREDASQAESQVENPCHERALLLLHPTFADDRKDRLMTKRLIDAAREVFNDHLIALAPNNDPGSDGIDAELRERSAKRHLTLITHLSRPDFLRTLGDCSALIGNSSSGIIEAGSFGTPVLDIGPRQQGRERGPNVRHVDWDGDLVAAIRKTLRQRRTRSADNPYERGAAGRRIANVLASLMIDADLRRKVIRY